MTYNGTVKCSSPDKGYGFIRADNPKHDVFIHISALQTASLDNLNDN